MSTERFLIPALALSVLAGLGGDVLRASDLIAKGGLGPFTTLLATVSFFGPLLPLASFIWPKRRGVIAALGALMFLVSGFFSLFAGPGALHVFLFGFAIWASTSGIAARSSGTGALRMGAAGLVAFWSLVAMPVTAVQAIALADGQPYCLAIHGLGPASLTDLHGITFRTDRTGYKDSSRWYFHGILMSAGNVWNWSPRPMRFDGVGRPDGQLEDPRDACVPEPNWLFHHIL